jgi:hypothetical protein
MKGQIAQKVRDIFQSFNINPKDIFLEEEVKLEMEGKLQDGTSIYTSAADWAVGSDVYTKDANGAAVPLQAGEYTLEDGRSIVIGTDAKIAEINDIQMPMMEDMSTADLLTAIESLSSRVSALEGEKTELLSKLSQAEAANVTKSAELSAVKTELSKVKQMPAADSVKSKRIEVALARDTKEAKTKTFAAMTVQERVNQYLSKIK